MPDVHLIGHVDRDADHIKAQHSPRRRVLHKPPLRGSREPLTLAMIDRLLGRHSSKTSRHARARPHLHKRDGVAPLDDQVDLPSTTTPVPLTHDPSGVAEVHGRRVFTAPPELMSRILTHRGPLLESNRS